MLLISNKLKLDVCLKLMAISPWLSLAPMIALLTAFTPVFSYAASQPENLSSNTILIANAELIKTVDPLLGPIPNSLAVSTAEEKPQTASDNLALEIIIFKDQSNQLSYVEQALAQAYQAINVKVTYVSIPYARALQNANNGSIDGIFGIPEKHAKRYSELVKLDLPLSFSNELLVIDNLSCNKCEQNHLSTVAIVNGYPIAKWRAKNNAHAKIIHFTDHHNLINFFARERSQAIIINDTLLPASFRNNPRYQLVKLEQLNVYHYLHAKHQNIVDKLEEHLKDSHLANHIELNDTTYPNQTETTSN